MKPSTRFLVVSIAWIVIGVVLAVVGTIWQTRRTEHAHTLSRLQSAAAVEADLQTVRFTTLQLRARTLANDPAFVAYIAHALVPNPAMGGAVDSLSISDLLNQRRKGYDVAMILDSEGRPVATSGILLKDHASIANNALITRCLATGKPTHGMWADHGRLMRVTVTPLMRGGSLRAILLAASRVDDAFAIAIARITGTDIAILVNGASGALVAQSSGLDVWETKALASNTQSMLDVQDMHGTAKTLADAGQHAVAWVTPLPDSHGRAVMTAMDASAGSNPLVEPTTWPLLGGIAILGFAVMIMVLIHWRRTCLPMDQIRDVIEHAANGDHFMHARVGGSSQVRQLRDAVNKLLQRHRV